MRDGATALLLKDTKYIVYYYQDSEGPEMEIDTAEPMKRLFSLYAKEDPGRKKKAAANVSLANRS